MLNSLKEQISSKFLRLIEDKFCSIFFRVFPVLHEDCPDDEAFMKRERLFTAA